MGGLREKIPAQEEVGRKQIFLLWGIYNYEDNAR